MVLLGDSPALAHSRPCSLCYLHPLDASATRNKTKVSGVEEVCCLYIRGRRQRGPQMGYLRASVQRLCGSPLFLSPPRTAAALLYDSRQSHKYKKKKATSPHISFSLKSSPLILPGDLPQGLVTRSELHVHTSPLGRRSLGVSWMLGANHRDYHSCVSAKSTNTAGK